MADLLPEWEPAFRNGARVEEISSERHGIVSGVEDDGSYLITFDANEISQQLYGAVWAETRFADEGNLRRSTRRRPDY